MSSSSSSPPTFATAFLACLAAGGVCFFFLSAWQYEPIVVVPSKVASVNTDNVASMVDHKALVVKPAPPKILQNFASHVGEQPTSNEVAVAGSWKNAMNVVHIVNTRFMQHQSKLPHLAQARMDLLQTITAPSLQQQTTDQFLWVIWTDELLEENASPIIVDGLKVLAAQHPNLVVVKAESVKGSDLRSMYGFTFTELSHRVLAGDAALLWSYHEAAQTHLLVETRLDSDDAFSANFVESTQVAVAAAMGNFVGDKPQHFCPESHLEWHYYANEKSLKNLRDASDRAGSLAQYDNEAFCIHSGWTTATYPEGYGGSSKHGQVSRALPVDTLPNCEAHEHPPCNARRELQALFDRDVVRGRSLVLTPRCPTDGVVAPDEVPPPAFQIGDEKVVKGVVAEDFCCPDDMWACTKTGTDDPHEWLQITDPTFNGELGPANGGIGPFDPSKTADVTCVPQFCGGTGTAVEMEVRVISQTCTGGGGLLDPPCKITELSVAYKYEEDQAHLHIGGALVHQNGLCNNDPRFPGGLTADEAMNVNFKGVTFPQFGLGLVGEADFSTPCLLPLRAMGLCVGEVREVDPECRRKLQLLPDFEELMQAGTKKKKNNKAPEEENGTTTFSMMSRASVMLSRVPTNAGMKNVLPGKKGGGDRSRPMTDVLRTPQEQQEGWEMVNEYFGVSKESVEELRERMEGNMENILVDAFAGQCTPGHSCKQSTKKALGYLLDKFYHDRA